MGLPIAEQIALNLFDTIASVKQANGYAYNVIVERQKRQGNAPDHLKAVMYQGEPTIVTDAPFEMDERNLPFEVMLYVITGETEEVVPDTYVNIVSSDIQTAVMADRTRGGLAIDTRVLAPVPFTEVDGKFDGTFLKFEVQYRTALDDPTQLVG